MKCPLCKNEMAISASRTLADRDDRPDLETRVWVEQELRCRSRGCTGYGRVQAVRRVYLIGGPDPGEGEGAAAEQTAADSAAGTKEE